MSEGQAFADCFKFGESSLPQHPQLSCNFLKQRYLFGYVRPLTLTRLNRDIPFDPSQRGQRWCTRIQAKRPVNL